MPYLPEDLDQSEAIAIAQARAKALRASASAGQPTGQMIGNGGFQHYVAPHWSQRLSPIVSGVLADVNDERAIGMQKKQRLAQEEDRQRLLSTIPQDRQEEGAPLPEGIQGPVQPRLVKATSGDRAKWGLEAMRNPLTKTLGQKVVEDALTKDPSEAATNLTKELVAQRQGEAKMGVAEIQAKIEREKLEAKERMHDKSISLGIYKTDEGNKNRRYVSDNTLAGIMDRNQKYADAARAKIEASGGVKLSEKGLKEVQDLVSGISRQEGFQQAHIPDMIGPISQIKSGLAGNWLGELAGLSTEEGKAAHEFWRDFKSHDNVERHELFGAAITVAEEAAWKATTVTPWSSEADIRNAIQKRKEILQGVLDRKTRMAGMNAQQQIAYARQIGLQGYNPPANQDVPLPAPVGGPKPGSSRETAIEFQEGSNYESGTWVKRGNQYKRIP